MERVGEWRVIEAEEPDDGTAGTSAAEAAAKSQTGFRILVAAVVMVVLGVAGLAIWATLPQGGVTLDLAKGPAAQDGGFFEPVATVAAVGPALVVDVEGAVVSPGVHTVPVGGRVADAIAGAGGYSTEVDIAAAARALNLAALVTDGQKIHVPARGEVVTLPGGATDAPGAPGGPIDINHASQEQLESLPGIGPVTAAKIIAERPFATIDELDSRDVVGPSVMEQIRDLITVTP
ncbi:MAG TPA: ComEA family DNA-binding protein [Candidatus Limnocylindria bacterium]|nr:ComEA family DNA-binding protein [Candidatus Limnocylindria bacterium]